ncbi:MAG TPA: LCP family protein [Candidatus Acidoferrales bacterium]|nr:LCP family protein [Candidatus Acidoferrales bacterium]
MRADPPRNHYRLLLLALVVVIAAVLVVTVLLSRPVRQYAGRVTARLTLGARPMNILLVANNARDVAPNDPLGLGSAAGQADVILLARLDPAKHVIYAITIPRDALVAQPTWRNTVPKIKTLFFMGDEEQPPKGPEYLARAVSKVTGLPVDGYLVANFAGFEKAVDLVGGLTIDVRERIFDPQNSHADFAPGVQHMDGEQVLAFIRVRQNQAGNSYRVNDYQRMQAEVEVLGLLRDKLLNPLHAERLLPEFVVKMKHDVATNIPEERLVRLGIAMAGAPVYQVPIGSLADSLVLASTDVPGINRESHIDGASYDVLDERQVVSQLAQFGSTSSDTGLPQPPDPRGIHIALYGDQHLALHLEHLGFAHIRKLGEPTGDNEVIFPSSVPSSAWLVARSLGTGNVYVTPGDVKQIVVRE